MQEIYPSENSELLQVEKQLDFRAEREGRDKKERDEKKRAFKNLVSHELMIGPSLIKLILANLCIRRKQRSKRRRRERRQQS